ncbi:MAG: hypothetical protein JJU35_05285 [Balneolales bacterium]|nr:hypothetical protein [Balneolales bacterium]
MEIACYGLLTGEVNELSAHSHEEIKPLMRLSFAQKSLPFPKRQAFLRIQTQRLQFALCLPDGS